MNQHLNHIIMTVNNLTYVKKGIIALFLIGISQVTIAQIITSKELYNLNTTEQSRSISFENPTGEPGEGGKAASEIGVGRKGAPRKTIKSGEEVILCNIKGSGTINHIWMTGNFNFNKQKNEDLLRSVVIRAYWDGQEHPSIECPIGDFFGLAHGKVTSYQSAVHSIGGYAALNIWLPMPFLKNAKIVLSNESDKNLTLYYQIDYNINVLHPENFGRLHVLFRRENPTIIKQDFEILPKRNGSGRFIGAVLGVRSLQPGWWGEGEVKFYMDGDDEFPTICGTGSEDYVGLSYGIQPATFLYHGCNLSTKPKKKSSQYISMYRWHLPDPIYWKKECRITIQQIGCCYYERSDDWSTATFWYESIPSKPLPKLPAVNERTADLEELY